MKKQLPVTANRLSSCVSHNAFIGADGSPIADVSAFSDVLDNILIMNYDVWGGLLIFFFTSSFFKSFYWQDYFFSFI